MMINKILPLVAMACMYFGAHAQTTETTTEAKQEDCHATCSSHQFSTAPIGLMNDHMHSKGSLMFSYRYMHMNMAGNQNGTSSIDDADIFSQYMVAPQDMTMGMHMIGAMYGVSDNFTLMLMANYLDNDMSLTTKMGMDFETESAGFGDMSLSGLVKIYEKGTNSIHGFIGVSIPTGDIDQKDDTPMMMDAQMGYPMQLGSGTWDPYLGANYSGHSDAISWGLQAKYKFRLGENANDYTLGNNFNTSAWGAIKAHKSVSVSVRANYWTQGEIDGADPALNPMMMPLADARNSGRSELDLLAGVNVRIISGLKIGLEAGYPVYQDAEGSQMSQEILGTIGATYSLGKL